MHSKLTQLPSCSTKCSGGVEQDERDSLPNQVSYIFLILGIYCIYIGKILSDCCHCHHMQQLLLFGFGFFILISVSAYVANLAAFLSLKSTSDVTSMSEAVARGYTICAHPAVKSELEVAWPGEWKLISSQQNLSIEIANAYSYTFAIFVSRG